MSDEKSIEKPITMVMQEFTETLVKIVNDTPLPLFVKDGVLCEIYQAVHNGAVSQAEKEKAEYEAKLKEATA